MKVNSKNQTSLATAAIVLLLSGVSASAMFQDSNPTGASTTAHAAPSAPPAPLDPVPTAPSAPSAPGTLPEAPEVSNTPAAATAASSGSTDAAAAENPFAAALRKGLKKTATTPTSGAASPAAPPAPQRMSVQQEMAARFAKRSSVSGSTGGAGNGAAAAASSKSDPKTDGPPQYLAVLRKSSTTTPLIAPPPPASKPGAGPTPPSARRFTAPTRNPLSPAVGSGAKPGGLLASLPSAAHSTARAVSSPVVDEVERGRRANAATAAELTAERTRLTQWDADLKALAAQLTAERVKLEADKSAFERAKAPSVPMLAASLSPIALAVPTAAPKSIANGSGNAAAATASPTATLSSMAAAKPVASASPSTNASAKAAVSIVEPAAASAHSKAVSAAPLSSEEVPLTLAKVAATTNTVTTANNGAVTVITDNSASALYQLESQRFPVKGGETIRVPYEITVEKGGKVSLGLLNTARRAWYGAELILGEGTHKNVYERVVPEGQIVASVVLRNYHLGQAGQSTFTVQPLKIVRIGAPATKK